MRLCTTIVILFGMFLGVHTIEDSAMDYVMKNAKINDTRRSLSIVKNFNVSDYNNTHELQKASDEAFDWVTKFLGSDPFQLVSISQRFKLGLNYYYFVNEADRAGYVKVVEVRCIPRESLPGIHCFTVYLQLRDYTTGPSNKGINAWAKSLWEKVINILIKIGDWYADNAGLVSILVLVISVICIIRIFLKRRTNLHQTFKNSAISKYQTLKNPKEMEEIKKPIIGINLEKIIDV